MDGQPTPSGELRAVSLTPDQLRRAILQYARMWEQFGVAAVRPARRVTPSPSVAPCLPSQPTQPHVLAAAPTEGGGSVPHQATVSQSPSVTSATLAGLRTAPMSVSATERQQALHVLAGEVRQCTNCDELASTRTQTVFGVGNSQARVCFFGEAPGADEDRQGEPFVGRAGELLNRIIEACGMRRQDVYILNVLKCRPPGNRNPNRDESAACRHFFERQLEIVQPEYIVCLGAIAATTLLQSTLTIGQLRGSFHDWNGIKVLATYHPAYLLRNPSAKKDVWNDMKILLADMGLPIPDQKGAGS